MARRKTAAPTPPAEQGADDLMRELAESAPPSAPAPKPPPQPSAPRETPKRFVTLQELADAAENPNGVGIRCPKCSGRLSSVYYVRNKPDVRERQRVCAHCGHKYQTVEERL
jgi:hypothetical protein